MFYFILLSAAILSANAQFPPPDAMGCMPSDDPTADCYGALYTPTPGEMDFRPQGCNTHMDCYGMREPPQWCRLMPNQAWLDEGCHCDPKLSACVIDRMTQDFNGPILEYAFCYPSSFWFCPY